MGDVHRFQAQANPTAYALDASGSNPVSVGDLVRYDATNFYVKRHTAGNGPTFVGVAMGRGPTPSSSVDNASNLIDAVKVQTNGIFTFVKTTGDSLVHGDPLVVGADAQTVLKQTSEDDSEIIGYVWDPLGTAANTGAGTTDVLIRNNFPATGTGI